MTKRKNLPQTPYKLVLVEWEDSQRPLEAWQWLDEYALPGPVTCLSAGFLIAERETAIAIAPNLGDIAQSRTQACGIICIPKCAVKNVIEIAG